MRKRCINCKAELPLKESYITGGICSACIGELLDGGSESPKAFLDRFEAPLLLMQPEPRRVRAGNRSAGTLFGKDLSRIEGLRGGEVFNCEHSFTQAGCGLDEHCQGCIIRDTIVDTFRTGRSFTGSAAVLNIKKNGETAPYAMEISTELVGQLALVRIDQFEKKT